MSELPGMWEPSDLKEGDEPLPWDEPEVQQCDEIVFHGSPNPDSAHFGPDEQCDEDAVEGETKCVKHLR